MKKLISALLTVAILFTLGTVAFAQEENQTTISIISANVAGLPIPSAFSDDGKIVPVYQKLMGKSLNNSGIDVICVQEDFQFHNILAAQMTNYPYQTYTSGGVPAGSGVNIFSKYPIYNVERYSWVAFNGILDAANDGLTPKGLVKATIDKDGVLYDVYDLHIDANGSYEDCMAKKAQFNELLAFIEVHSKDRPIIMTGDWNVTLHGDIAAELYPILIEGAGYSDAWTLFCNDGVYFTGYLPAETIAEYDKKFGGYYWGHWDSVERVLFKDGDGTKMTVSDFRYSNYTTDDGAYLSDHAVMFCELTVDTTDYVRPDAELTIESKPSVKYRITDFIEKFFRALKLIIEDLFRLYVNKETV